MSLTANRDLNRYVDQEIRSFAMSASAHIYKGALVGLERVTGFARPLVAGDVFAGIAYEEKDNSAGAAGVLSIRLYTQGDFILTVTSSAAALIGSPVFALDDDTTGVSPSPGASYCGILVAVVGANLGIVRIQPMAGPQDERSVDLPIASLTSGVTTNPLLITMRAIKILSIHACFNTVPDQGALDIGTSNTSPTQIVSGFSLSSLAANTPTSLTLLARDVAKNLRIWAKVGQASSTAGVGGILSIRYFELP